MGSTEGGYEPHGDEITLTVAFRNKGMKPISAFKGDLVFSYAFGDRIYSIRYDESKHITAGATIINEGSIKYNSFEEAEQKLRNLELSQMKSHFEATAISFADGSMLVSPEASN